MKKKNNPATLQDWGISAPSPLYRSRHLLPYEPPSDNPPSVSPYFQEIGRALEILKQKAKQNNEER